MSGKKFNTKGWQATDLSERKFRLREAEVHVWLAPLVCADYEQAEKTLSGDEKRRAEKFISNRARENFIAARRFLRQTLAAYLETEPEKIRLDYTEFGKPSLAGKAELCFNLSHSGDFVVLALTEVGEIGVDLEFIEPKFVEPNSAAQFLTAKEIRHLFERPKNEQAKLYFDFWTRKEAYLKMRGDGLMLEPSKIDINSLIEAQNTIAKPELLFFDLPALEGYSSALAVENKLLKNDVKLICLRSF